MAALFDHEELKRPIFPVCSSIQSGTEQTLHLFYSLRHAVCCVWVRARWFLFSEACNFPNWIFMFFVRFKSQINTAEVGLNAHAADNGVNVFFGFKSGKLRQIQSEGLAEGCTSLPRVGRVPRDRALTSRPTQKLLPYLHLLPSLMMSPTLRRAPVPTSWLAIKSSFYCGYRCFRTCFLQRFTGLLPWFWH